MVGGKTVGGMVGWADGRVGGETVGWGGADGRVGGQMVGGGQTVGGKTVGGGADGRGGHILPAQ